MTTTNGINKLAALLIVGVGEDRDGNAIAEARAAGALHEIKIRIIELSGGVTVRESAGAWATDGKVISEKVVELLFYVDNNDRGVMDAEYVARYAKMILSQQCVALQLTPCNFNLI